MNAQDAGRQRESEKEADDLDHVLGGKLVVSIHDAEWQLGCEPEPDLKHGDPVRGARFCDPPRAKRLPRG